jgi:predicted ATPase
VPAKKKVVKKRAVKKIDGIPCYCSHDAVVAIKDLRPNPDNPNTHPDEQIEILSEMIKNNGWRDRITVSNRSGMIVKGHGRYMAAIRAGLRKTPVDYQDYATEADEVADLVGDNKISEFSIIDEDAAKTLLKNLDVNFDLRLAGFEIADVDPDEIITGKNEDKPEVVFSQEMLLEHNYIVLYFDNPMDWQVALDKFKLKRSKGLVPVKNPVVGIGRVVEGGKWLDRIN